MKNLFLTIFAFAVVKVTMLPVILFRILFCTKSEQDFKDYMFAIAIGLDQLGGSYLYGKPDWTVSSYTHYLASLGNRSAKRFSRVIDFLFGEGHCYNSFINEIATHEDELDALQGKNRG